MHSHFHFVLFCLSVFGSLILLSPEVLALGRSKKGLQKDPSNPEKWLVFEKFPDANPEVSAFMHKLQDLANLFLSDEVVPGELIAESSSKGARSSGSEISTTPSPPLARPPVKARKGKLPSAFVQSLYGPPDSDTSSQAEDIPPPLPSSPPPQSTTKAQVHNQPPSVLLTSPSLELANQGLDDVLAGLDADLAALQSKPASHSGASPLARSQMNSPERSLKSGSEPGSYFWDLSDLQLKSSLSPEHTHHQVASESSSLYDSHHEELEFKSLSISDSLLNENSPIDKRLQVDFTDAESQISSSSDSDFVKNFPKRKISPVSPGRSPVPSSTSLLRSRPSFHTDSPSDDDIIFFKPRKPLKQQATDLETKNENDQDIVALQEEETEPQQPEQEPEPEQPEQEENLDAEPAESDAQGAQATPAEPTNKKKKSFGKKLKKIATFGMSGKSKKKGT